MTYEARCAVVSPFRLTDKDELQVLMTLRGYRNFETGQPLRFPGETTLIGGACHETDGSLEQTAARCVQQQVNYRIDPAKLFSLRGGVHHSVCGFPYFLASFGTWEMENVESFKLPETGEITGAEWYTPHEGLDLMNSKGLRERIMHGVINQGLAILGYCKRQKPEQVEELLHHIIRHEEKIISQRKN